jgi:hypothetical protein
MRCKAFAGYLAPALAIVVASPVAPTCRSELIYFARGGQVQAPARVEGDQIWVETPAGGFSFRRDDFLKIVPGGCPEREWGERRLAALRDGAEARLAAAWWALENGLVPEAVAMLQSAHEADPNHQPTARLVATLERLDRPCTDPETDHLRQALGVTCDAERGPHVLLLHQHDRTEALARVDLLERVTIAYYLLFAARGIDLTVPNHRFVSVYLRDQADYRSFLESQHAGAFRTTLGYFHPTFRAVVSFDPRSTGNTRAAGDASADPSRNPSAGRDRVRSGPSQSDLHRRHLLLDLETRARADGTAAHEMVHLLVTTSGLAPNHGDFPLWLHEGLAAQFEVVRGGRWAGVGRAHDLRLHDWRALVTPPDLPGLIRDAGFGHGYRRDLYARSWSLVYFLRTTRPREFLSFLDLLRSPDPDRATPDPDRFEPAFRSAFGSDLPGLERDWAAFMNVVQTPLEENAPSTSTGSIGFRP